MLFPLSSYLGISSYAFLIQQEFSLNVSLFQKNQRSYVIYWNSHGRICWYQSIGLNASCPEPRHESDPQWSTSLSPLSSGLGVKRQKRFQLSSARTTLSSRSPPLFRAGVLSRWLFSALMERLFSVHKMKWISAPEPEIGRRRQLCHPLPVPFLSPLSLPCSLSSFLSCDFQVAWAVVIVLPPNSFGERKFVRIYYNHSSKPSLTVRRAATICQSRWIETVAVTSCHWGKKWLRFH